ncbi:ABC transporter permease [Alsobacter sp. SYSU M60028]|uniref:Transport permease protein n=1 Tax=Alsobacter ponti TaxID=2962936 RepID=A0ABT1LDP7_9HYPH|nr:ABC transporter permease [Alsobacter ponti]MCP8939630.1 ABC transporter permease [Alsobacter ponti]
MTGRHALAALVAISWREIVKFTHQKGRLFSAIVRPTLWLIVFAAGFQNVFGVSIIPPYESYITYQEYVLPGLMGIVLLFNGMQSSLSMVYDREMGVMRLLLTAPLPRWYTLLCKLAAGTLLSVVQAYAFLVTAWLFGVTIPWSGWITILPALVLSGLMLGAIGLALSVHIRQLENFAGTMNFVIFPMFFVSSALYPLWKLEESGAVAVWRAAQVNPFTHAVELVRFAAYGQLNGMALAVVAGSTALFFLLAVVGYDPQRGMIARTRQAAA